MTFSKAVLLLAVVAFSGGGCGKGTQKPAGPGPQKSCRCGADAGVLALVRASDAGVTARRPVAGRRVQHFTLLAAAKGYRNHQKCVATVHASLPPELTREADSANLAERICQTRRALAEKRPALCEEIDDPVWPVSCRRLYAVLHGKPDECPPRTERSRGRDALCLALAARDPALCRAVRSSWGRVRCAAILGSASLCRGMRTTAELASCQLDRKRWRSVLRPGKASLGPKYAPKHLLDLTAPKVTLRGASGALNLGVVVPRPRAAGRWFLGGLRPTGRRTAVEKKLLLMADLPPVRKLPAALKVGTDKRGARFCALWKGRAVRPGQIQGEVKITQYSAKRGARVVGTYAVTMKQGDQSVTVKGVFDTFVRDVIPGAWARRTCADRLAEVTPAEAPKVVPATTAREPGERPCFFLAHWQGLRQLGYRVYGVRARGTCAQLGLRNGDVVLSVGGRPRSKVLARWADVVSLYAQLAGTQPLVVNVLRLKRKLSLKRSKR